MSKTFVYDGQEVRLTGRTASKQVPQRESKVKTSRRREDSSTAPQVVEIESISDLSGASLWRKWVKKTDLYQVDTGTQPNLLEENDD